MFYDSPLLPGFLLVALIALPYEVSTQSSFPCNYLVSLSSSLPSFYWPSVFKADVKCKVSCYISFSRKNKRVWAHVTTGAMVSR